jgi:hypothetical protein
VSDTVIIEYEDDQKQIIISTIENRRCRFCGVAAMSNNIRAAMSRNFNLVGAPIHLMSRTNEEQGVFNDLQDDVIPG